jgi:GT2 family glycosyltransferase
MRALILNDRSWHYECYIHIIDFCRSKKIQVDILELYADLFDHRSFYKSHFPDTVNYIQHIKINDKKQFFYGKNKPYDIVFLPTDNLDYLKVFNIKLPENHAVHSFHKILNNTSTKDPLDKQIVFIDHTRGFRNHLSNHVDIRYFSENKPYAYPCAEIISKQEKIKILSQETSINVVMCANPTTINTPLEITRLKSLSDNIKIYWIHKNLSSVQILHSDDIKIMQNCNQKEFHEILKKTHYVYVPNLHNKDYKKDSTTGVLNQAFSFCCQLIWPDRDYNKFSKLYSPLEYSDGLGIDNNPNIDLVAKERRELIGHRNKVFSTFLPKLKHKLYATTLNYNQPELTDNIYNELTAEQKECIIDIEILDNGSSKNKATSTTLPLSDNLFFGGGVNVLLKKFLESDNEYFAIINNDIIFYGKHFFDNAIQEMIDNDVALYSPSVINSTIKKCSWPPMWNWYTKSVRNVDFIDWMFPIMRRDLAELIVQFPEDLHLGWGLDFYSGIIAKENGLKVGVSDNLTVSHLVSNTFRSGNIDITENKFSIDAGNNMNKYFLNSKYKSDFLLMHQTNLEYKI